MEQENFRTLGEISKAFLTSLDIKVNRKMNRLCREDEVGLENLKLEIFRYFESLEPYDDKFDLFEEEALDKINSLDLSIKENRKIQKLFNQISHDLKRTLPKDTLIEVKNEKLFLSEEIVNIIADNFFYIYKWYNGVIEEYTLLSSQKERNQILLENLYIPMLKRIFKEIEELKQFELLFDYDRNLRERELFNQIKENILKKSNIENYNFLRGSNSIDTYNYEGETLYKSLNTLGKAHHSNNKLLYLVDELLKNDKIKSSGLDKETILINLVLARMYHSFIKKVSGKLKVTNSYDQSYDLYEMLRQLDRSINVPIGEEVILKMNEIDKLKKLVSKEEKKGQPDIREFENLYTRYKRDSKEFSWFIEHCYAKHLVFKNELDKALEVYLENIKEASYKGGKLFKLYIKEAIALAVYLEDKVAFKKIYKKAFIHGLRESNVENEWVRLSKDKMFNFFFPRHSFYGYEKV